MAIDVDHGALQGTIALGKRAISAGAIKEETIETLRVAYHIEGTGALRARFRDDTTKSLQNLIFR